MTRQWISIALKVSLFFAIVVNPQLYPIPPCFSAVFKFVVPEFASDLPTPKGVAILKVFV